MLETDWKKRETLRIIEKIGNEPIVLYGAGKYGQQSLENIRFYFPMLNVRYFIDDNRIRNRQAVYGVEVISLADALKELGENFHIIISNYYVPQVLEKLEAVKFDLDKVHFIGELMIEEPDSELLKNHRKDLIRVYDMLKDYKSKMIFRTMLESRFTKNIDILSNTCDKQQYFPQKEIFEIGNEEVFVDAGAFDGDTIEQFLSVTGGKYKKIYAFEPDRKNYSKLVERGFSENIKIFHAGLYNKEGELSFSADKGGSSRVEEEGQDIIKVCAIDTLKQIKEPVTFVKMDIEGSELKALEGMQHVIMRDKPKLAVCIYHKIEDLWELPLYLKKLVPEYRLYIRNYTTYLDEVVLYATV